MLAGVLVSLCASMVGCDDSGTGDGTGGGGSGGSVLDGSSSGGASGAHDGGGTTTESGSPDSVGAGGAWADGAPADSTGAGGAGGSRDAGGTFSCGSQTCNPDLEYCRTSLPGTGGAPGYSCIPRKGCETCDCIAPGVTCTCGKDSNGFISVTCSGV
jgi:hypothetical protein